MYRLFLAVISTATLAACETPETACRPGDPPFVTIFLIDGLTQELFTTELAAGRLPHLHRLVTEGLYVEDGITAFPSMTGYAFYPFLTGRDATESGVLGLRWFDRGRERGAFRNYVGRTTVQMNRDLNPEIATLYEELAGSCTTTFNSYFDRGVDSQRNNAWDYAMAKTAGHFWLTDFLAVQPFVGDTLVPSWHQAESHLLEGAIADLEARKPKVQWIGFASPDTYSHNHGIDATYGALVRHIDSLIGRYRQASQRLGTEEQRIYMVISDHGVVSASTNLDLRDLFSARGLHAYRGPSTTLGSSEFDEPLSKWADVDAQVVINGNMMNYLYIRNPDERGADGWRLPVTSNHLVAYPTPSGKMNLVEALVGEPGVELVMLRGEQQGVVEIHNRSGVGTIRTDGGGYTYSVAGEDPLEYVGDPRVGPLLDRAHDEAAWLKATHRAKFPYAVPRVARLFAAPDMSDLAVTCREGYELARDFEMFIGNYRGGHGGLRADQMRVPFVLAGPGVPAGSRIAAARSEDLGATLRALLGLPTDGLDGRVLLED